MIEAMGRRIAAVFLIMTLAVFAAPEARAQQGQVWIQLEAHPDFATADQRVRAYAQILPDTNGFALRTGWYAIALGPYTQAEATDALNRLRQQGAIPRDAYLSDSTIYQQQFFPAGNTATQPQPIQTEEPQPVVEAQPVVEPEETPQEARRSEGQLNREEREALQIAMQWFGHYNSGIDGAFGPGTRAGMSSWQASQGLEETGVLTTRQRATLLAAYQAELDAIGMQNVRDERAGIAIDLPLAMVEFARYEFPFAQFDAVGGSGVQVLLISQEGTRATLGGLYEIMQTLEIVPLEGERNRRGDSFVLSGQSASLRSHTIARLQDGQIKGFTLIWTPERDAQMARVLEMMEASFETYGGTLDPGAVDPGLDQGVDLMAGLDVRQPVIARSGFWADANGAVVTTAEAVAACTRILVADQYVMELALSDAASGLAVLRPTQALAPTTYASFPTVAPRLRSDVAVAGFPYEGALGQASLNFGTLEDLSGLNGEAGLQRLAVSMEPSEAGAPVLDANGSVLGMMLPEADDGRALPPGVSFALAGDQLAALLTEAGLAPSAASATPQPMTRNALARYGADLSVLVTCWN